MPEWDPVIGHFLKVAAGQHWKHLSGGLEYQHLRDSGWARHQS